MSDEDLRQLERSVVRGVPNLAEAGARLQAACARAGHVLDEGTLCMAFDERAWVLRDLSSARTFYRCKRCRAEVPYEGGRGLREVMVERMVEREEAFLVALCAPVVRAGELVTTADLEKAGIGLVAPEFAARAPVPRLEQAHPERRRGRRRRRR
jgi:hypothetical protein